MGHTPGPWSAYPPEMLDSKNWSVQTDSGMTIVCGDDTQETEANAHLIAAAPELLEALINCRDWLVYITGHAVLEDTERGYLEAATAAIDKAEGRSE